VPTQGDEELDDGLELDAANLRLVEEDDKNSVYI
jgi:hypothetical protein